MEKLKQINVHIEWNVIELWKKVEFAVVGINGIYEPTLHWWDFMGQIIRSTNISIQKILNDNKVIDE